MPYKQEMQKVKENIKADVIKTACEMYMAQGIEPVKMTDVAKQSSVGVASLYRYFGTKSELVIQAGIFLWHDVSRLMEGIFQSEIYMQKTGLEQCRDLLKLFLAAYTGHAPYLKFLRDFDLFMESENVQPAELAEYEKSILDLQTPALLAYKKGTADKTIKETVDFDKYYFTTTHTLMLLSQKLVCAGGLISSDTRVSGEEQLKTVIDMAIEYIKRENGQ